MKLLKIVEFCEDGDELLGSIPVRNFFTFSITAMWQTKTSCYEKVQVAAWWIWYCSYLIPKCLKFHIFCVSYSMFTKRILAVTDNKMFLLVCAGRHTYFELHLKQECTNPGCHITHVTKFFTLVPHIFFGSLVMGMCFTL